VCLAACGEQQATSIVKPTSTPTLVGYLGKSVTLTMTNLADAYGGPVLGKTFEQATCADLQTLPYHTAAVLHGSVSVPLGVVVEFKLADGTLLKRRFFPSASGSITPQTPKLSPIPPAAARSA
jgi:hypothetical protein